MIGSVVCSLASRSGIVILLFKNAIYSYLQVYTLVRIGELGELFGVHRSTIWRNMWKLELAGLVRSVRTEYGMQVEMCGSWVESAMSSA